ncbi:MAG: helix-turn-helix transcriptional regulator, partial [Myxococcaceae bacterium]
VDAAPASAFCLADELIPFTSEWHSHRKHQLLYSVRGALRLEMESGQWLLPPQRAAWIRAGARHRVSSGQPASLRTVYLSSRKFRVPGRADCQVFILTPLAREMILHSTRWGPERSPKDRRAEVFFTAMAELLAEWTEQSRPWRLPRAKSAELQRAMDFTLEHLDESELSIAEVSRSSGLSERTLARRFQEEAQTSWRAFLHDARMLRAMELLAEGERVTQAAFAVGFESLAAFSHGFHAFTGERPKDFRRRVTTGTQAE